MKEHYIIAVDGAHLRIYAERNPPGQSTPALVCIQALDFPEGREAYAWRDTDQAGRFQHSSPRGARNASGTESTHGGMSIDERLPMKNEEKKRRVENLAGAVDDFLAGKRDATWDFAAGPEWHRAVLEKLSSDSRHRLRSAVDKNLIKRSPGELHAELAAAAQR